MHKKIPPQGRDDSVFLITAMKGAEYTQIISRPPEGGPFGSDGSLRL